MSTEHIRSCHRSGAPASRSARCASLEGEIADHLGYDKGDAQAKDGVNHRNGSRVKTVLTEVGPVEIAVPREPAARRSASPSTPRTPLCRSQYGDVPSAYAAQGLTHSPNAAAAWRG